MSAARVLQPMLLPEFCKMRASPSMVSRNLPCGQQLKRIKRDLFGSTATTDVQTIFAEEMEKHQQEATKKWGFDFRNGSPAGPNSNFIWERVSFSESIYAPEMYALTRAAHVRPTVSPATHMEELLDERSRRENCSASGGESFCSNSTTDESCDESQDESVAVMPQMTRPSLSAAITSSTLFKVPPAVTATANVAAASSVGFEASLSSSSMRYAAPSAHYLRKRQPKITEYMKERKRLAQTPKKSSPAAKRMRLNSSSCASNNAQSPPNFSMGLGKSQTIDMHFTMRSLQRRH